MVQDEDSSISQLKDARTGPPKVVVVGVSVLGSLVAILLVFAVLWLWATARSFIVPQSAMAPSIFGGDEIHADATEYGLRLPVLGTVGSGYPNRGDIIVFDWPKDRNYIYVMRVVAVAGDEVQVPPDGTIDLRGHQLRRCAMGIWPKGRDPNGIADGRKAFVEWNNDSSYVILVGNELPPPPEEASHCVAKPCTVPEGHVFVLGDNRSASADSRNWGFVPLDHVIGKVSDARVPDDLPAYKKCMESKPDGSPPVPGGAASR